MEDQKARLGITQLTVISYSFLVVIMMFALVVAKGFDSHTARLTALEDAVGIEVER